MKIILRNIITTLIFPIVLLIIGMIFITKAIVISIVGTIDWLLDESDETWIECLKDFSRIFKLFETPWNMETK